MQTRLQPVTKKKEINSKKKKTFHHGAGAKNTPLFNCLIFECDSALFLVFFSLVSLFTSTHFQE